MPACATGQQQLLCGLRCCAGVAAGGAAGGRSAAGAAVPLWEGHVSSLAHRQGPAAAKLGPAATPAPVLLPEALPPGCQHNARPPSEEALPP